MSVKCSTIALAPTPLTIDLGDHMLEIISKVLLLTTIKSKTWIS